MVHKMDSVDSLSFVMVSKCTYPYLRSSEKWEGRGNGNFIQCAEEGDEWATFHEHLKYHIEETRIAAVDHATNDPGLDFKFLFYFLIISDQIGPFAFAFLLFGK